MNPATAKIVSLALIAILHLQLSGSARANSEPPADKRLKARMVLVIPSGANAPKNYQRRLASVATRTEKFIAEWMEHWGRRHERPEFFERNSDGSVQVTLAQVRLQGQAKGRDSLPELRKLAIESAEKQLGIRKNTKTVWWIFYQYPGMKGFRGGGNSNYGSAINAYPGGNGLIDQNVSLASLKNNDAKLKGMIHEFGHALGLPHNGPRLELDLGNSLMGPIGPKFFKKTNSQDRRVYLNEVSAALIWKHQLFQKAPPKRPVQPKQIKIDGLYAKELPDGRISVGGVLKSNLKAHSAIVYNTRLANFKDDYWSRSHLGKIEADGTFVIDVNALHPKGKLCLSFCFNNGINTADGRTQTIKKSVVEIAYSGNQNHRKFTMPATGTVR